MYLQGACKVCVCVRYLCMHVFMYVCKVCVRARVWIRCICMCVSCVCVRVCVEGVYVCVGGGERGWDMCMIIGRVTSGLLFVCVNVCLCACLRL